MATISILLALVSLIAGGLLVRATVETPLLDRVRAFLVAPLLLLCVAEITAKVLSADRYIWNEIRLARTFGLYRGVPLYPGKDATGPILGTLHTPLSHILYWPATLASNAVTAVRVGVMLSVLLLLTALVLAHSSATRASSYDASTSMAPSARLPRILATLFSLELFWLGAMNTTIMSCAFVIHADPIALVCSTLAGGMLLTRPLTNRGLVLSALCAVLAVASKQTFAALPIALAVFLLLAEGRQIFLRYCVYLVGWAVLAFAAVIALFRPVQNIRFNLLTLASHRPPQPVVSTIPHLHDGIRLFLNKLYHLVGHSIHSGTEGRAFATFLLLLCIWTWLVVRRPSSAAPHGLRHIFARNRWLVFVLIALVMFPLLFKASITIGGDQNHLAIADFFLFLGFTTGFSRTISSKRPSEPKTVAHLLAFALVLFLSFRSIHQFHRALNAAPSLTAEAASYSRAHPGVAYFPSNPLSSVYSIHRFYTFDHSVDDREIAGYPLTAAQYQSGLPPSVVLIAVDPYDILINENSQALLDRLHSGWTLEKNADLPDFAVYRQTAGPTSLSGTRIQAPLK